MNSNQRLSLMNFPYNIEQTFIQICYYKIFQVNLKRIILTKNKNLIKNVRLINSIWFEKWKKLSGYEAIKDDLNMSQSIRDNYNLNLNNYLDILNNLSINETLENNINNFSIIGGYNESIKKYEINPYSNFDIISPELWDNFVPSNTVNVNNGTLVELELEYLTKKSLILNLNKTSCYIIFWNINQQKLGKIILIFPNIEEKNKTLQNIRDLGINNFYACYLEDLKDSKNVNNPLTFFCINRTENYNIITKNEQNNGSNINEGFNFNQNPVGLDNIFLTCYMNSALQSLVHVPKLSDYFLQNRNNFNYQSQILSSAYLKIVENLLRKTNDSQNIISYSPKEFYSIASENPLFQSAGDSIDMINYYLQNIHEELNFGVNGNNLKRFIINTNLDNIKIKALNNSLINFTSKNQSIITNLFYFIEKSKLVCCNNFCRMTSYSFQVIYYLIFPLEEIRKIKSQMLGIYQNSVNLMDGFDNYKKQSLMTGENKICCSYCGMRTEAYQSSSLYSLPEILIINLNRGQGNMFDVSVEIPNEINLTNQVESNIDNNSKFKLICIITHLGPSGTSGHFIAFCLIQDNNKWYKFNDSIVTESNFTEATKTGDTYVLFYQRCS